MILPVTLSLAAACAVLTLWLMLRCGQVRVKKEILHGDGGDGQLSRRMRAQLNFVESAPFVVALVGLVELAGKGGRWLAIVAAIYVAARIAHVFGMERQDTNMLRGAGVGITMLTLLGLAIYAALITAGIA
ncbi:MAG: MAPEG family protein [Sphingomonadales bacterium]|nr:MAPEG family protein [Sphingomonadales bacterium]MBD3774733.1 MAPEG family protein [Paracoccaceae bacterium]